MPGFFDDTKGSTPTRSTKGKTLSCASCGLYKYAGTYKMEPYGGFKKNIINIGEGPGESEDRKGKPWQGKVGRLLKRTYRDLGIDLFEDCLNINAVNCRPPGNKTPSPHQIACCRNVMVEKEIIENQPEVIVAFGGSALQSLIAHRWKGDWDGINKWRGWTIPDRKYKAWIVPTYHPSFITRFDDIEAMTIWKQDLQTAIDLIGQPLPKYKKPDIEFIEDLSILENLQTDLIAFDYETTGLKPHADGHDIVCVSVAPSPDKVYVFMMPKKHKDRKPFINLLANPGIGKIAHNMKFEEIWSREILGQPVQGWKWDAMLAAHMLDNRKKIAGLKFQTYVQLGIVDYASEIESYIKNATGPDASGNDFNSINKLLETEEGKEKLLRYCGFDSVYEMRLASIQLNQMEYDYLPIY